MMVSAHPFDRASWYRAMTLAERAETLKHVPDALAGPLASAGVGGRLFERWRAQAPFADEALFRRRLAVNGLTVPAFRYLLDEPIDNVALRAPEGVPWLDVLERVAALPRTNVPVPLPVLPGGGFLELVRPLVEDACRRLKDAAATLARDAAGLAFEPATVDSLLASSMAQPLLVMMMRTMVLELNVAKLQGQLSGASPSDRFDDFIERLHRPDVRMAIFLEYPVLARHLVRGADQWVEAASEFLAHLVADRAAICALFCPHDELGPLIRWEGNAGDRHRGGRAVGIATFRSGLKLVYKPKSLALDAHFQDLLEWLNENGADPAFRVIKVLDRGDHGWMEFVEREPCDSLEAVERFYARQGENLALLYALGATDFHYENVIAAGEHPVLVDLEALFHPRFVDEPPVSLVLKESLFRTGLLPARMGARGEYAGMDISGLGSPEGQLTPHEVSDWEDRHQDSMRFVRRRLPMRGAANQPTLRSAVTDAGQHLGPLHAGFDTMYELLARHRDVLVAESGPIERFARDPMRLIMRNTRSYQLLCGEAFHPDALRDALDQDRIFDHLWAATAKAPYLIEFVEAERAALARYDVPLFMTQPNSVTIVSEDGVQICDLIAASGLETAKQRVLRLDACDQARQHWCIDAAFATTKVGSGLVEGWGRRAARRLDGSPVDAGWRERLIRAACAVGERLATLAFVHEETVAWQVVRQIDRRHWAIGPAGLDLYGGLPGIVLFLSYLERCTGDDRHTALTRRGISTLRNMARAMRTTLKSIGGFEGWGGLLYTFTVLASVLEDRDLLSEAESIVEILPDLIAQDNDLDVISGAAGCIAGLLCLHRAAASQRTLAAAVACGERLLDRTHVMEHGIGWRTPMAPDQPLCGLSHGAAGIAWALLELSAATGDARFQAAAEQAFVFERSQFSAAAGTWLDLRRPGSDAQAASGEVATAWCHGAPGIGLVRIRALAHGDSSALRQEIALAVAATIERGFGHNHSLCHGDLGNLELLRGARAALPDTLTKAKLEQLQIQILDSIERQGALCATPEFVDTPGLMLGLAGIGYGLLRLAEPTRVPSILLLEGPPGPVEADLSAMAWNPGDVARIGEGRLWIERA